jgi:hypothetical protein
MNRREAIIQHFFEIFDKGEQKFEYRFRIGKLASDMGWMMTAGNVNGKKEGKAARYWLTDYLNFEE